MAYTDDAVLAKLSALNESHDSIATAAQWIMFHRRRADRTVAMWLQKLKESPSAKRLNLIYLANEVTQQSKARNRPDFTDAFSPIIADATATAYKGATPDVQTKVRRVVEVWRERSIFEPTILGAIEGRIQELDKARGVVKANFGSSAMGSPVPSELVSLLTPQQNVSKLILPTKAAVSSAEQDYEKNTDPKQPVPSPPVYAARLNGLLKTLASAEGAVAECVKARNELIRALEKLLDTNKTNLETEEEQLKQLSERKAAIDTKKRDVETAIMRGLADQDAAGRDTQSTGLLQEPGRPEVEALTPPPVSDEPDFYEPPAPMSAPSFEPAPATAHTPSVTQQPTFSHSSAPGIEMLSNLASQYQAVPISTTNGANKRRRLDSGDDFPDLGNDDGIDPNIDDMIRK